MLKGVIPHWLVPFTRTWNLWTFLYTQPSSMALIGSVNYLQSVNEVSDWARLLPTGTLQVYASQARKRSLWTNDLKIRGKFGGQALKQRIVNLVLFGVWFPDNCLGKKDASFILIDRGTILYFNISRRAKNLYVAKKKHLLLSLYIYFMGVRRSCQFW